jgi:hypothetical protein
VRRSVRIGIYGVAKIIFVLDINTNQFILAAMRRKKYPKIEIRYQSADVAVLNTVVEQTNHALGIMLTSGGWAGVLLLPGVLLQNGFASKAEAHRFNEAVAQDKTLSPGEPTLAQFIAASGGEAAARAAVEACREKAAVK